MFARGIALLAGVLLSFNLAHADAGLRIGQVSYGGSGCPGGSTSVSLSPDETAVSILFDNYIAEAGGYSYKTMDRKSCNISVPIEVPNGYSIAIFQLDYRGFQEVPYGANNQFNVEYFWAGQRGPSIRRTFRGPYSDSFTITDRLLASTMVWSRCGESVNLRINSDVIARTNRQKDQSMAAVDTVDLTTGLIYHLQLRRCY